MKVLMVNKFLHPNGGSETYIFKLGDYLISKGHEVQYFGMDHEGRCVGNRVNAYTSDMDFHGGSIFAKLTYPIKTIYNREARTQIRKVLEDFQPEVVHLNNFNYQLTPSIILETVKWRKSTGKTCRIIYTAHDGQFVCPNHMLYNPNTKEICKKCIGGHFLNCTKNKCIHGSTAKSLIGTIEAVYWKTRGTYKFIDTIICPSNFMKSTLDTNPVLANKTITLINFINKSDKRFEDKKDYVLYFGSYTEGKGVSTLLKVCKELSNIQFVFAGDGELKDKVNDLPNVTNVGFKSGEELDRLIGEAKFTICPSELNENCPFTVLESQEHGTPVIGSKVGGITELIQNGVTGELFKSGDAKDLKSKIDMLWKNTDKCMQYSNRCKDIKFDDIEQYCEKLIKIYRESKTG